MADRAALVEVLGRSRDLGFLGPGPIEAQIEHAERFWAPLRDLLPPGGGRGVIRVVDLGAGGGVPSLPLLSAHDEISATLVEALQKRWSFLVWALLELSLDDRAQARRGRAEDLAHRAEWRGRADAVVARGFGPPSTTVECGAALLRPGGRLVISEPPARRVWPAPALASVGLRERTSTGGVVVLERDGEVPAEVPRPARVQQRAPLFEL